MRDERRYREEETTYTTSVYGKRYRKKRRSEREEKKREQVSGRREREIERLAAQVALLDDELDILGRTCERVAKAARVKRSSEVSPPASEARDAMYSSEKP
jgi:hypothetical protein